MTKTKKAGDGLERIGVDAATGKLKYKATITYRVNGERKWTTRNILADDKADALVQKNRIVESLKSRHGGVNPHETVSEAIEEWLATLRPATEYTYRSLIGKIQRPLGERVFSRLTTQEIIGVLDGIEGVNVANSVRRAVHSLCRWGKETGRLAANPVAETKQRVPKLTEEERLRLLKENPPKPRRALLPHELERFVSTLERDYPETYMVLMTQLLLGCRIGEAIALEWADIDMATGEVIIRNNRHRGRTGVPKGKKSRWNALSVGWRARLAIHREQMKAEGREGWEWLVFPGKPHHRRSTPYYRYETLLEHCRDVMRACGIKLAQRTQTHAMRHTLASISRLDNADFVAQRFLGVRSVASVPSTLQQALGHSHPAQTDHYTDVPNTHLVEHAERVAQRVLGGGGVFGGDRRPPEPKGCDETGT